MPISRIPGVGIESGGVAQSNLAAGAVAQSNVATGVAGTGPAFNAQITTTQTITLNVNTKVVFGTEYFDTNSNYDASNGRFTPTVAGYYQINAQVYFPANSTSYAIIQIQRNGSEFAVSAGVTGTSAAVCQNASTVIYLNGSTDYVEVYAASGQTGTITLTAQSRFSGALVRAA